MLLLLFFLKKIITVTSIANSIHFISLWKGRVPCLLASSINHNVENQIGYFTLSNGKQFFLSCKQQMRGGPSWTKTKIEREQLEPCSTEPWHSHCRLSILPRLPGMLPSHHTVGRRVCCTTSPWTPWATNYHQRNNKLCLQSYIFHYRNVKVMALAPA